jgi:hypothetical protein
MFPNHPGSKDDDVIKPLFCLIIKSRFYSRQPIVKADILLLQRKSLKTKFLLQVKPEIPSKDTRGKQVVDILRFLITVRAVSRSAFQHLS